MSPEYTDVFRRFFKLRDLWSIEPYEWSFEVLATIIAWRMMQRHDFSTENDKLLHQFWDDTTYGFALPLFFAPFDEEFFRLAQRTMAATLVHGTNLLPGHRAIAAGLLVSDPPTNSRPKAVRDALIVMALQVGCELEWTPTENEQPSDRRSRDNHLESSGSHRLRESINHIYSKDTPSIAALKKIWLSRESKLTAVGFNEREAKQFLQPRT